MNEKKTEQNGKYNKVEQNGPKQNELNKKEQK